MGKETVDMIKTLYIYYEIKSSLENGDLFTKVVDDFSKKINETFNFIFTNKVEAYQVSVDKGLIIIDNFAYEEEHNHIITPILLKYNYYMKTFIKDSIRNLSKLEDPNKNKELIERIIKCPVIDDVSFDGKSKFTIFSEEYGEYSFFLATEILKEDWLRNYINKKENLRNCHGNTVELINRYDEWSSITSLCKNYFKDYYYHSYGFIPKSNQVIDLCSNMIMDKNSFDKLYEPKEILNLYNITIKSLVRTTIPTISSSFINNELHKLAIYYQSLELEKNPQEKIKVMTYKLPPEIEKTIK